MYDVLSRCSIDVPVCQCRNTVNKHSVVTALTSPITHDDIEPALMKIVKRILCGHYCYKLQLSFSSISVPRRVYPRSYVLHSVVMAVTNTIPDTVTET